MELDEMKLAWQALDHRLDEQRAFSLQMFRENRLDRLRHGLRPLVWGQSVQGIFGLGIMLWGAVFWTNHVGPYWGGILQWHFACGLFVQLFGTTMMVFAARILALALKIDYGSPVVEVQRRISQLRAWRVKVEAPVFAVLGAVVWIPVALMLLQGTYDDMGNGVPPDALLYAPGLATWLLLVGAGSVAVVFAAYLLLRRLGLRRWLENNFAGSTIVKAEAALEEIARFEHE